MDDLLASCIGVWVCVLREGGSDSFDEIGVDDAE